MWWLEERDGALVRLYKRFPTPEAATVFVAGLEPFIELEAERAPSTASPNRLVFAAFLAAHRSEPEGTQRRYATTIRTWLAPTIGETIGDDMSLAMYLKPLRAAMEAGRKRNTVATVETALGAVATWAVAEGWWPPGPFGDERTRVAHVRELKRSSKRQDADVRARRLDSHEDGDSDRGVRLDQVPSWELITRLGDAVERREQMNPAIRIHGRGFGLDPAAARQLGMSIQLAAATGLRQCELLGLHESCIDLATGEIDVVRQLDRYEPWLPGGPPPVRAPKFGKRRTALAFAFFLDDLAELCEWAGTNRDGWLFARSRGQRWWADAWTQAVVRGVTLLNDERASLVASTGSSPWESWRWPRHFLRHWFGSMAVASVDAGGYGLSLPLVADVMGHSSPAITAEIYLQETPGDRDYARRVTARRPT